MDTCRYESCGCAGVQRGMCGVLEVRMLHIPCMVSVAGRGLSRVESTGWCRRKGLASARRCVVQVSMFADGSLDEASAVSSGRRPEAIADEFSE